MIDPRLKIIADELRGYTGDCICDEAYTSRRLVDPSCSYHIVPNEEAAADIIAALDAMEKAKETTTELPASKWNVFLHDPERKYGDHFVTVTAATAKEAEEEALAQNPGATIAHETVRSPYIVPSEDQTATNSNQLQWGGLNGVLNG